MTTRRSRIQIKPNTGPRIAGRPPALDASPSQKSTVDSPVKSTPLSPVKATPLSPVKLTPSSPSKPQPQSPLKFVSPVTTKPPVSPTAKRALRLDPPVVNTKEVKKNNDLIASEPIQDVSNKSQSGKLSKTDSNDSVTDTTLEKCVTKTDDKKQMSNGTISAPVQRTRLKKPPPKVPGPRKAQRRVEKENILTEVEKPCTTEVEPEQVSLDEPAEHLVQRRNAEESVTDDLVVFKKPEIPKKKNVASKGIPSSVMEEPSTPTLDSDVVPFKINTTKKSRSKESDGSRNSQKHRIATFKQTEPPDRTKMTIMDLIHWNPIQNPMKRSSENPSTSESPSLELPPATETDGINETLKEKQTEKEPEKGDFIPGPRVIVGEDGQITLDESSLVIEQTAPEKDLSREVLYETSDTTYASYSKKIISRQLWSMKDTALFYKALSVVGPDFTLMAKFFPKRTRAELKRKFKKEERTRRDLLDKAVSEWHNFDLENIQDFLFCKEMQPFDSQEEEEARVDNPEGFNSESHPNNYVRENLMNVGSRARGRRRGQANKNPKNEKEKAAQKQKSKKNNKRPASRNAWSDEEAEAVDDENMINLCDNDENIINLCDNDEEDHCQEPHDDLCDCCQVTTKTSKRQKCLEAKKLKLEQLEQQKAKYIESCLSPLPPSAISPPPESISDTVSFTVITKSLTPMAASVITTPSYTPRSSPTVLSNTQMSSSSPLTPRASNGTVNSANKNSVIFNKPTSSAGKTLEPPVMFGQQSTSNGLTREAPTVTSRPHISSNKLKRDSSTSTPQTLGKSSGHTKDVSTGTPESVNLANLTNPVAASPLLQAILNRASPSTSGASPGQFLLVADKTPNNEQVLHVYLVSPNTAQPATQSPNETAINVPNSVRVRPDTLQRLGIRPIVQQQTKMDEIPSNKS